MKTTTVAVTLGLLLPTLVSAQTLPTGRDVKFGVDVTIEPHLDTQVPADLEFTDQDGRTVRLGEYFDGDKPIVLQLVYLRCPMLCGAQLDGLSRTLAAMSMTVGEDFDVLTVSFDPEEPPALARSKRENYLKRYNREAAEEGWHFLTGRPAAIRKLTDTVGFQYVKDEQTGQYAHAAGLMILTPDGRIARYLFGVDYSPRDLRLAVVEAARGEIATVTDQVLLFCYLYDATSGKYGLAILNLLRAGGLLTVGLMFGSIVWMSRRSARATAEADGEPAKEADDAG